MDAIKMIEMINSFGWADFSIEDFIISYERISVRLSYNYGNYYNSDGTRNEECSYKQVINCENYIGFTFVGHWDENIIEYIRIDTEGNLILDSLQEIKSCYGDPPMPQLGGGVKKIDNPWYQLNIKLIDGNVIKIAAESFEMEIDK